MDGPLADLDSAFFARCQAEGWDLDITDIPSQTDRFISNHVVDETHRELSRSFLDSPGFFRELPVVPGAREGVDKLLSYDLEIWLCTKPLETSNTSRDEKAAWVREHFPEFAEKIIMTPDKSLAKGDVLLDDAIPVNWIDRSYWSPVVYTMPYNGSGSVWANLPHFTWEDQIETLVNYCVEAHHRKHPRSITRHKSRW